MEARADQVQKALIVQLIIEKPNFRKWRGLMQRDCVQN